MKNKLECFHSTFLNQGKKYRNVIILNLCEDKVWSNGRTVLITYSLQLCGLFCLSKLHKKRETISLFQCNDVQILHFSVNIKDITSRPASHYDPITSTQEALSQKCGLSNSQWFFFFLFKQLPVWNVSSTWSSDWGRNRCEENLRFSRFGMSCVCLVKEIKF